jgi:hypothetical protein
MGHGLCYAAHIRRPREARTNLRTDQSHSSELSNERSESAERVAKTILSTYSAPNLTAGEIQSGVGKRNEPLREFSNICRRELESLKRGL